MEGVAHRQLHRPVAARLKQAYGGLDGLAGSADDALAATVDVGRYHIATHLLQRCLYDFDGGQHGSHLAVVFYLHLAHFAAAGGGRFQALGKRHNAGSGEGGIFAQRVAHDHIRPEAKLRQQAAQRFVHGEHGWLSNFRLHQVELGLIHRGRVTAIDEDVAGERPAQNGCHNCVGLGDGLGHDGVLGGQLAPHVHVLAALAREEISQFAVGRPTAPENALGLHRFPRLGRVEAHYFLRFVQPVQQFVVVAKVDDQPFGGLQVGWFGQAAGRRPATFGAGQGLVQLLFEGGGGGGTQGQNAAHRLGAGKGGCGSGRAVDPGRGGHYLLRLSR